MKFKIGCNYWGSKWGTEMWANFDKVSVEKDIITLSSYGVKHLRIFPIWRDFQPIETLYSFRGEKREYRLHGKEIPTDEYFLDYNCVENFKTFCRICDRNGITLTVSILTGWMSGKLYCPPALNNKNLITDSEALMLESKFVKGIVKNLKDEKNIIEWDLGNECNCLSPTSSRYDAYVWTNVISTAIRSVDNTRPISSGMHSLVAVKDCGNWYIQDQGELCDVLSVHPYPSPTVLGNLDPLNAMRTTLVPTTMMEYYSGIGGKPCGMQETGSFGKFIGNNQVAADFLRVNLYSAYANDGDCYLWWCAHEQKKLDFPPYSWSCIERELGLLNLDLSPKPVALEMKRISEALEKLNIDLPKKSYDGVILTVDGEDFVGIQQSASMQLRIAGLDMTFRAKLQTLPKVNLYVLPSLRFWATIDKEQLDFILEQVREGASFYLSLNGATITEGEEIFGVESFGVQKNTEQKTVEYKGYKLPLKGEYEFIFKPTTAEVLIEDEGGNVVLCRNRYGKGYVYLCNMPLEKYILNSEHYYRNIKKYPYYEIYKTIGEHALEKRELVSLEPNICSTVHKIDENSSYVTLINYSDKPQKVKYKLNGGYKVESVLYGNLDNLSNGEMALIKIKR